MGDRVRLTLVRHGRASAGWDAEVDPGLDHVGRAQAEAVAAHLHRGRPQPILVSPLRRCRETAEPLARLWGVEPEVEPAVGEIPSPPGVPMTERRAWLQAVLDRTWSELGARYTEFRNGVVDRVLACVTDTVIVSHFVAINAVIGASTGDDRLVIRRLDNASRTVVAVHDGRLVLVQGGLEGDTLIR